MTGLGHSILTEPAFAKASSRYVTGDVRVKAANDLLQSGHEVALLFQQNTLSRSTPSVL